MAVPGASDAAGLSVQRIVPALVRVDALSEISPLPVKAGAELSATAVETAVLDHLVVVDAHVRVDALVPVAPDAVRAGAFLGAAAVDAALALVGGTLLAEGALDALVPIQPLTASTDALAVGVHGVRAGFLLHVAIAADIVVVAGLPPVPTSVGAVAEFDAAVIEPASALVVVAVGALVRVHAGFPLFRPLAFGAGARLVAAAVEAAFTILGLVISADVGIFADPVRPCTVGAGARFGPAGVESAGTRLLGAVGTSHARRRGSSVGQVAVGVHALVRRGVRVDAQVGRGVGQIGSVFLFARVGLEGVAAVAGVDGHCSVRGGIPLSRGVGVPGESRVELGLTAPAQREHEAREDQLLHGASSAMSVLWLLQVQVQ